MKKIEVVAAIITCGDDILCVQRGAAKYDYIANKFEFPGGKIEEGETPDQAIIREIQEELHIALPEVTYFATIEHQYPDFYITMHAYKCPVITKDLTLTEHISQQWLRPHQLNSLDWAAADIPFVEQLMTGS